MPELPEVETIVRDLRALGLVGARVVRARVFWAKILEAPSIRRFRRDIQGCTIMAISRRGKFLVLTLSDGLYLLVHLRMTGQLKLCRGAGARGPHEHMILDLADGRQLRYRDPRKFGRWTLLSDPSEKLGRLGPEPLDKALTPARFARMLEGRTGMLKPLLLNQGFIAGLGNIYVDEALWDAGLHPCRAGGSLSLVERRALLVAIRKVLRRGIRALGTTLGGGIPNFSSAGGRRGRNQEGLRVFRRTGLPCPRCGSAIRRLIVGQRSTHVCPDCQVG